MKINVFNVRSLFSDNYDELLKRSVLNFNTHVCYAFNKVMAKYDRDRSDLKWQEVESPVPPFQPLPEPVLPNVEAMVGRNVVKEYAIPGGGCLPHYCKCNEACCSGLCKEKSIKIVLNITQNVLEDYIRHTAAEDDVFKASREYIDQEIAVVFEGWSTTGSRECIQARAALIDSFTICLLSAMNKIRFIQLLGTPLLPSYLVSKLIFTFFLILSICIISGMIPELIKTFVHDILMV